MTHERRPDLLRGGIAAVLRIGTLGAMALIGIGYLAVLVSGDQPGSTPLLELLGSGGGPAVIGLGLLGLTLVPAAVLGIAALGLQRHGERRLAVTTLLVLTLLLASLVTAVVVTAAG